MSNRKKGKVRKHDHPENSGKDHQKGENKNESNQAEQSHDGKNSKAEATTEKLRTVSRASTSRLFSHNPENVNNYFKTDSKIKTTFEAAKTVPNNHLKNGFTGEIGELATEKSVYALKGNERVIKHETKVGANNGLDHALSKGDHLTIESKATRVQGTFKLTQTKTQGQQMSTTWIGAKIREMTTGPTATPGTIKTATLLSNEPFTRHISGVDVDYGTHTYRHVTEPHRYGPLPQGVQIWDATKSASHFEMKAMKTVNGLGRVAGAAAYAFDGAQVIGQVSRDIADGDFGSTFRLVLEKGCGYAGAAGSIIALEAGTGGAGFAASFVVGAAGYDLGESACSGVSDFLGLPTISAEDRDQNTREGMDILAGPIGTAVVDAMDYTSEKISNGVSSGCEFLNDKLPIEICTPEKKVPVFPEAIALLKMRTAVENTEPNASYPSDSDNVHSEPDNVCTPEASVDSSEPQINASYPSDADQLTCKPEPAVSGNSRGVEDKPLGFHARRLEIMKAHAEHRSTAENTRAPSTTCEAPTSTTNQSVLNSSEEESTYESPSPSPS